MGMTPGGPGGPGGGPGGPGGGGGGGGGDQAYGRRGRCSLLRDFEILLEIGNDWSMFNSLI